MKNIILVLLIFVAACHKPDAPKPTHMIAYTAHSTSSNYILNYIDETFNVVVVTPPAPLDFSYSFECDTLPVPGGASVSCYFKNRVPGSPTSATVSITIDGKLWQTQSDTVWAMASNL